jgi:hypothetical protein
MVAYSDKDFIVYVDVSKEGLGGVLTQEGHAMFYESQKLKYQKQNYVTHKLELLILRGG